MSVMKFKLIAGTNVGNVRTNNEDNFIVNENLDNTEWFVPEETPEGIELGKNGAILVVADGMGGMNAGEVASAIAIDTVKECFTKDSFADIVSSPAKISSFLLDAIVEADKKIKDKVKQDSSTSGMGTTIVIAWVLKDTAHVAWCGDSRAYLFNAKSGLSRITKDHSYVQELVDAGKLDPELAFDHPNSNIITRSLGDSNSKARPEYVSKKISTGDVILLCSDGLCGLCRDEEIAQILSESAEKSIEDMKNNLINAALNAGGYDNVTVALLQTISLEEEEEKVTHETNNDLALARKRKKKSIMYLCLVLILLLAAVAAWLYLSGFYSTVLEYLGEWMQRMSNYFSALATSGKE